MTNKSFEYMFDVIVIGGGHAGVEAAWACARLGSRTLLLTIKKDMIGAMPCNPALGGIGKGHLVYELAAFGGLMPKIASKTYLHARMLNTSKGPAVHGLRLQIDKLVYKQAIQDALMDAKNLTILEDMVEEILVDEQKVSGVRTRSDISYYARNVIVATGTFLNGVIHIGHKNYSGGRATEEASIELAKSLTSLGVELKRFKTGTPARLDRSSVDFAQLEAQDSENLDFLFEFDRVSGSKLPIQSCYITHTNQKTHDIIKNNITKSPMYSGVITGKPPRYCPSIEDKIMRFADKNSHHVFVEPESSLNNELYPNGISTSLPQEVQEEFIRSIKGFENARITRSGYAIEYDYAPPKQIGHTLESRVLSGLFFAGQINGTTGYEEAAVQGCIAGINAHLKVKSKNLNSESFIVKRTEGYTGVMIDDLVSFGVDEPYRMFTSRSECRLTLRQDNTFARLYKKSYEYGLISYDLYEKISKEREFVLAIKNNVLIKHGVEIARLLSIGHDQLVHEYITQVIDQYIAQSVTQNNLDFVNNRVKLSVYAELLYGPYLKREEREIEKMEQYAQLEIPKTFEYRNMPGLSIELQQKLILYKPATIAHAALIQGMTPAAISLLIFRVRDQKGLL